MGNPTTTSYGMFPSDVVLRTGIMAAIADLRSPQNGWVLDYIWNYLANDQLTINAYGIEDINRAKEWFAETDIKVVLASQMDNVETPCLHITLLDSVCVEATIGDVAGDPGPIEPFQDVPLPAQDPIIVVPPFNGLYAPTTGWVTMPNLPPTPVFPAMVLVNGQGQSFPIIDIVTPYIVAIPSGLTPDLTNSTIQTVPPSYRLGIESEHYRESYRIGCLVDSEPAHLMYLYALTMFILSRYRQTNFEARGLERISLSASDFKKDQSLAPEVNYIRYITVQATVIQSWPKFYNPAIQGAYAQVTTGIVLRGGTYGV